MNRKTWKQNYKRYGRNKIKRLKTRLDQGKSLQRKPSKILSRKKVELKGEKDE